MADVKNDGAGCQKAFLASLSEDLKHAQTILRNATEKMDNYRKRYSDKENEKLHSSISPARSSTVSARSRLMRTLSLPAAVHPPTPALENIMQDQMVLASRDSSTVAAQQSIHPKKIYVKSLAYRTNDNSLGRHFNHFGAVFEARVFHRPDGRTCNSGMVEFKHAESANEVLRLEEPHVVDGRHVIVSPFEDRRTFHGPRRDGCV